MYTQEAQNIPCDCENNPLLSTKDKLTGKANEQGQETVSPPDDAVAMETANSDPQQPSAVGAGTEELYCEELQCGDSECDLQIYKV